MREAAAIDHRIGDLTRLRAELTRLQTEADETTDDRPTTCVCHVCDQVAAVHNNGQGHDLYRCWHRGEGCKQPSRSNNGLERATFLGLELLSENEDLREAIRSHLRERRWKILVARYRIRVGRAIGSEALITDGRHARTDALTSLAVVGAGVGAAFGATWVDPVAGLVVAGAILWLLATSARRMSRRVLDGIEPEIVDRVEATIRNVAGVHDVTDLRVRWHGHQLRIAASIAVGGDLTVKAGHDTAHNVEHALHHHFSFPITALIHVDPHGLPEAHDATAITSSNKNTARWRRLSNR